MTKTEHEEIWIKFVSIIPETHFLIATMAAMAALAGRFFFLQNATLFNGC